MSAACFRPIQLFHSYKDDYDCAIPRCLPTLPTGNPTVDPILALVEVLYLYFQDGGLTEEDLIALVEATWPGLYTTAEIQAALQQGLHQGLFVKLVPVTICCNEDCPPPRFTFSSRMDASSANRPYVAYLYAQVTSSVQRKKETFYKFFRAKPNCSSCCQ